MHPEEVAGRADPVGGEHRCNEDDDLLREYEGEEDEPGPRHASVPSNGPVLQKPAGVEDVARH